MFATTSTFCSVKSRADSKPVWMIQNPASRTSISTMVAVAARLINAFRQNPCHARRRLNTTNPIIRLARSSRPIAIDGPDRAISVGPVVGATDLVTDDPAFLERDDALPEGRHDVGVVGCH